MQNLNDDIELLTEYSQWVSSRKLGVSDNSPEEFMRDRLKEVAFDRVQQALDYLNNQEMLRTEPNKNTIRGILDGTYTKTATSVEPVREEPDTDTDIKN